MRIALFGGTGFIGMAFLEKALGSGENVCALVRDAARVSPQPYLDVIQGNVQNGAAPERVIAGSNAVVSVLGPRRVSVARPGCSI